MKENTRLAAFIMATAMGTAISANAQAQGVNGTTIGAPDPGRFAINADIGVLGTQFGRVTFGDVFQGTTRVGRVFDDQQSSGGVSPALGIGWGLPGGLFGMPAEVFGRFAYMHATAETTASIPVVPGQNVIWPWVSNANFFGSFRFSNGGSANTSQLQSTLNSYDGGIGLRLHMTRGRWGFSPFVSFNFQRLDQDNTINSSDTIFAPNPVFVNTSSLSTDYYQFGGGIGVAYMATPSIGLFGVLSASVDIVRSRLDASTTTFELSPDPAQSASASDTHNRVSGRVGLRTGVAVMASPNLLFFLSGEVQYVGAVAGIDYGLRTSSAAVGTTPVIVFDGQVNYGGRAGATIRF